MYQCIIHTTSKFEITKNVETWITWRWREICTEKSRKQVNASSLSLFPGFYEFVCIYIMVISWIKCDSCKNALERCLLQDDNLVEFVFMSLTETESNIMLRLKKCFNPQLFHFINFKIMHNGNKIVINNDHLFLVSLILKNLQIKSKIIDWKY